MECVGGVDWGSDAARQPTCVTGTVSACGAAAAADAAVAHLLPSVQQPVSLLPPPGALGPSAAAARAALAAQLEQQQEQEQEQGPEAGQEEQQAAQGAAPGSAQLQAVPLAGAVLEALLTDAWGDEDVISAFERLQPPPPAYSQLCNKQPAERVAQQQQFVCDVQCGVAERQQQQHQFAEYVLNNALLGAFQEGGVVFGGVGAAGAAAGLQGGVDDADGGL